MEETSSRLFALAVEEFIERYKSWPYQNQDLLEKINAAYEDMPDQTEQDLQRYMRRQHRKLVTEPRDIE